MATKQELLEEAHRRGLLPPDMASKYLEAKKRGLVTPEVGMGEEAVGAATTFARGASLGWADEILGAGAAAIGSVLPESLGGLPEDISFGEAYEGIRSNIDKQASEFHERHPVTGVGLEIAGGMTTGGPGALRAAPAAAASAGKKLLRYAGIGGTTGGVAGAGYAEPGERLEGAAKGAAAGTVTGVAFPVVGDIGRRVAAPVLRRIRGGPSTVAQRQVAHDLGQDGLTQAQATQKLQRMGPQATVSDLGEAVRHRAETVAQQPGAGRVASKIYEIRNSEAGRRVGQYVDDLFQGRVKLVDAVETIQKRASKEAGPLYQRAFSEFKVLPKTPMLKDLMKRDMVQKAMDLAEKEASNAPLGTRFSFNRENPGLREWNAVKKILDDIGYKKAGENIMGNVEGAARSARAINKALLKHLDKLTKKDGQSVYKQARNIYSGDARTLEAMEKGQKFWTMTPDAINRELRMMSQSERDAFRLAAMQKIYDKSLDSTSGGNVYSRLFNSAGKRDRIKAVLQDDEAFERLSQKLMDEAEFNATYQATRANSATARRMAGMDEGAIDPMIVTSAFQGKIVEPILGALRSAVNTLNKGTPAQREQLAKLLMSQGDEAIQAVNQVSQRAPLIIEDPEKLRKIAAVLARTSGHTSGALVNQ